MELQGASKQEFINQLVSYGVTVHSIVKDKELKITCADKQSDLEFNEDGVISVLLELLKPEELKDFSETVLLQYDVKLSSSVINAPKVG